MPEPRLAQFPSSWRAVSSWRANTPLAKSNSSTPAGFVHLVRISDRYLRACGITSTETKSRIIHDIVTSPKAESLCDAAGRPDVRALQQRIDDILEPARALRKGEADTAPGWGRLARYWEIRDALGEMPPDKIAGRARPPVEMPVQELSIVRERRAEGRCETLIRRLARVPAHLVVLTVSLLLGGR